jgi:fatty acid desaturase
MDGPAPLFVVGTGRCGSTMLSDLLREHDRVLSLSEFFCFTTDFGGRIAQAFSPEPVDSAQLWEIIAGARQHALTVLNHDATHFRLLPRRAWNDWVANLFLAWPMFISVQGFRHFHGPHHRHLGEQGDGNRALWHTHDAEGQPTPEWRYPKTAAQLFFKLLRRAAVLTGLFWIARGLVGGCLYGSRTACGCSCGGRSSPC